LLIQLSIGNGSTISIGMATIEEFHGPNGPGKTGEDFDAESFLGFLRRSSPIWRAEGQSLDIQSWVYRGHSNASWKLVPAAARKLDENKIAGSIKYWHNVLREDPMWQAVDQGNRMTLLSQLLAYAEAIRSFYNLGNELGLTAFKPPAPFDPKAETSALLEFRKYGWPEYFSISAAIKDGQVLQQRGLPLFEMVGSQHQEAALAQHHGVPTFLLDWSKNPYFAAHFAAAQISQDVKQNDICVWALNLDRVSARTHSSVLEKFGIASIAASVGLGMLYLNPALPRENEFLRQQEGMLTYLDGVDKIWLDTGFYPGLEELLSKWTLAEIRSRLSNLSVEQKKRFEVALEGLVDEPILRKVILKREHVADLRLLLRREGISQAHLMQTLDNVAATSLRLSSDKLVQPQDK
jgi:hypothetical protein